MTAPRIPRRPAAYIPAGADQQGRLQRTGCFIQAAEAANDIGADDAPDFRRQARNALLRYLLVCIVIVAATAVVVFGGQP
jgi:hypothetical protein